jgi:hypothetical protein
MIDSVAHGFPEIIEAYACELHETAPHDNYTRSVFIVIQRIQPRGEQPSLDYNGIPCKLYIRIISILPRTVHVSTCTRARTQ